MMGPKEEYVPASAGPARKDFLAKLIPWGMALLAEAEGYGIEWRGMTIEEIEGAVIFAAEFARGKK